MYRIAGVEIDEGEVIRCYAPASVALHEGDQCIIDLDHVLESGTIERVEECEGDLPKSAQPVVVRCVTLQDQAQIRENQVRGRMATETCMELFKKQSAPMRLVRVRYSFDRKRLSVLFSAEEHVDYRELQKTLASELHARIEIQQIGIRDEAGMIGGIGPCGRSMCCATWLRKFDPVNVKMAKNQQLSLNPGTISGMCGRLKCCLRYENDLYVSCSRGLPRHGAMVECADGVGHVVDVNILPRRVKVQLEDGRRVTYDFDDIRILNSGRGRRRRAESSGSGRMEE